MKKKPERRWVKKQMLLHSLKTLKVKDSLMVVIFEVSNGNTNEFIHVSGSFVWNLNCDWSSCWILVSICKEKEKEIMITGCPYCSINTAGEHELTCPNRPSTKIPYLGNKFLDALDADSIEIRPGPAQVLIGQYIELLSAYAMTLDAVELAGEQLGVVKLTQVSLFIEKALKAKIDEIVALMELTK
jgi:hypothetical protein